MRRIPIVLAGLASLAVALPTSASAAGWKLPTSTNDLNGGTITSSAKRCGKSAFGTWKFQERLSAGGKYLQSTWKVKITKGGKAHRYTQIRVSGTAPASSQDAVRESLSNRRARYTRKGGKRTLEILARDGGLAGTREFTPKRSKRC